MKFLLFFFSLIFFLSGCSSLELESVPSSEQETKRILALGLSHEENLIEASKLDNPHKVAVVTLQLKNAREEKIQAELDLLDSNKYADKVVILDEGIKFISPEISENVKNGVLDTDVDKVTYSIEGAKDLNSKLMSHQLNLSLTYNSKNKRNYNSVKFCDKWNNCDELTQKINVISVNASNCKNNSCVYKEVISLELTDSFLIDSIEKGFSMRLMSKKKTNSIKIPKAYLMGYLKIAK
jgi:hypothetical protein